ncbi:ribonuclease H2 subunit B [Arctopsyche grandis]|uniref:ribonuclease H2 subunit B n=1 Tax=Arctopsyche grandis TaxID=121162 RepID=UPI00406D7BF6
MSDTKSSSNETDVNVESSRIFLSKDDLENSQSSIISLIHPGHNKKTKFVINKTTKKLYEIQIFNNPCRSWLIDETLIKDGNMYVCTPIDPLFIVLPHLKEHCAQRAVPLDHILESSADRDLSQIFGLIKDINALGDLKGPSNLNAYKYNEEKCLQWLESKVQKVVNVLRKKKVHVKPGSVSATFVISSIEEDVADKDHYLKYAFGIVSEYLNEDFCQLLFEKLNLEVETNSSKRKSVDDSPIEAKKAKIDSKSEVTADYVKSDYFNDNLKSMSDKKPKTVVLSAKEKQRQKAATGSKNITAFFSKK